jgi:hypothetical protein
MKERWEEHVMPFFSNSLSFSVRVQNEDAVAQDAKVLKGSNRLGSPAESTLIAAQQRL